eukprot:7493147-Heterocapsa_arctica.AAC.1
MTAIVAAVAPITRMSSSTGGFWQTQLSRSQERLPAPRQPQELPELDHHLKAMHLHLNYDLII